MYADESRSRNKTQWIFNECQLLVQHMWSDLKDHCKTEDLSETRFVQTEYMFKKNSTKK